MAYSNAKTVDEYIKGLPPQKSEVISKIRALIRKNIPDGIVETMNWGMITYEVPLSVYPATYNKKPLMYAALAAQKNHFSIYVTNLYMNDENLSRLLAGYDDINSKPNIGKSCIRFTKIDKIPLKIIGEIIASTDLDKFIGFYENIKKDSSKKPLNR
jgi:hypothetical protein